MYKGQLLSGDFILSLAMFIIALAIVVPLWGYVTDQIKYDEDRKALDNTVSIISDVLTKSTGSPNDWNVTNVKSIGLTDENGYLNLTKNMNFIDLGYDNARNLLGTGYNLYVSVSDIDDNMIYSGAASKPIAYFASKERDMENVIRKANASWDFYTGNGDHAQNIAAFNSMAGNQSIYRTIIIEDPELQESEVNIQGIIDFLNLGGVLIYEGNPMLIDTFGEFNQTTNRDGIVIPNDKILINSSADDNVSFLNAQWAAHVAGIQKIIADKNDNKTIVGFWKYGNGMIYYISDINGTIINSNILLEDSLGVFG